MQQRESAPMPIAFVVVLARKPSGELAAALGVDISAREPAPGHKRIEVDGHAYERRCLPTKAVFNALQMSHVLGMGVTEQTAVVYQGLGAFPVGLFEPGDANAL